MRLQRHCDSTRTLQSTELNQCGVCERELYRVALLIGFVLAVIGLFSFETLTRAV